jgi:hypothetical protein
VRCVRVRRCHSSLMPRFLPGVCIKILANCLFTSFSTVLLYQWADFDVFQKPPTCPHKRASQDKPPRLIHRPYSFVYFPAGPLLPQSQSYYRIHSRSLPFLPTPLSKELSVSRSPPIPVPHSSLPPHSPSYTYLRSVFFPGSLHEYKSQSNARYGPRFAPRTSRTGLMC